VEPEFFVTQFYGEYEDPPSLKEHGLTVNALKMAGPMSELPTAPP
jgi:hypothetical protein